MSAYSFLEDKRHSYYAQHRFIPILVICTLIVPVYFIFFQPHHKQHISMNDILTLERPEKSINLTLPELYYLDLSKYPIEEKIIDVFPQAEETIKNMLILTHLHQEPNNTTPTTEEDKYSCDQHLPPYPILQHLVKEYMPIHTTHNLFEQPIDLQKPFMFLPPTHTFRPGNKICLRVVVPFQNQSRNDPYRLLYKPYFSNHAQLVSPWWDTFMTSIRDIDTNASMPIQLQPWSGHALLRQSARTFYNVNPSLPEWALLRQEELSEREITHVYEADITVPEGGRWQVTSLLEFVEGRYNFEYGPVSAYEPVDLGTQWINTTTSKSDLELHLQLPLCQGMDHPGRWLPIPKDAEKHVLGVTRYNKFWAPFDCRYRHISYEQFNRCASQKFKSGINVFGDSNTRRSLKKFISHGKWCQGWETHREEHPLFWQDEHVANVTELMTLDAHANTTEYREPQDYEYLHLNQTKSCFCEDYVEYRWNETWFDATARTMTVYLTNTEQQDVGKTEWDREDVNDNVTVNSYKWDGLTFLNVPEWDTAVISMPLDVDVAIFSLGNWDAAFSKLDVFITDLDKLIRQIRDHYDLNKTRIIYRTPQYYCCRVDTSFRARQVSGPRLDAFDQEARKRFSSELNASIWDTYVLGISKTLEEKKMNIGCSSNHVPADEVEIENQILMNGLCNA